MFKLFWILIFFYQFTFSFSQFPIYNPSQIGSINFINPHNPTSFPILNLQESQSLTLSFDILSNHSPTLCYTITPCNWKWEELHTNSTIFFTNSFPLFFPEGIKSMNTTINYTHYSIELPNNDFNFKRSGNYKISCFSEEEPDTPILQAFFSISEKKINPTAIITTDTDKGRNTAFQQINIQTIIPEKFYNIYPIYLVAIQNNNWQTAQYILKESSKYGNNTYIWEHHPQLFFLAQNEFRKFEILNNNTTYQHIDSIRWDHSFYNVYLEPDKPRQHYFYMQEKNGAFFIRNTTFPNNPNFQSDYMKVHFTFTPKQKLDGNLYVCGNFSNYILSPFYQLKYNSTKKTYETTILLKQGYYNYTYLYTQFNNKLSPIEPSFYNTENQYTLFFYYHNLLQGYDELIGTLQLFSIP